MLENVERFVPRFSVGNLLLATTMLAATIAIANYTNPVAACIWLLCAGLAATNFKGFGKLEFWPGVQQLATFVFLQFVFAVAAICATTGYNLVAFASGLLQTLALFAHILPAAFCSAGMQKAANASALAILLFIMATIVPFQWACLHRLNSCRAEAEDLIDYVETFEATQGAYPERITEYQFTNETALQYLTYRKRQDDYIIRFDLTRESIHYYTPGRGWEQLGSAGRRRR